MGCRRSSTWIEAGRFGAVSSQTEREADGSWAFTGSFAGESSISELQTSISSGDTMPAHEQGVHPASTRDDSDRNPIRIAT